MNRPKWLAGMPQRALLGLADQVFSSLTNFAINIMVARSFGASVFGAFSIAFGAYVIFLNLSRSVTSEPLAIRFSNVPDDVWSDGASRASGTSLLLGAFGSAVCFGIAWAVDGDLSTALFGLGLMLPGLLYLDIWRFAFFARGKGQLALLCDGLWALLLFPVLGWFTFVSEPSLFLVTLAWGASATVASAIVVAAAGVAPIFTSVLRWLADHRDLTPHFAAELATVSVAVQLSLLGIGAAASLAAVGAYRAAHVLFGPLRVLYQGLTLFGVPEGVRVLAGSTHRLRVASKRASWLLAAFGLAFGSGLYLLPNSLGRVILGETWRLAEPLIIPFTVGVVAVGLSVPTYIGLKALEAARTAFRTRFVVAGADVVVTILGAAVAGASGATWAGRSLLLGGARLWWHVYEKRLRERETKLSFLEEGAEDGE